MSISEDTVVADSVTTTTFTGGSFDTPQFTSSGTVSAVNVDSTGTATLNNATISGTVTGVPQVASDFLIGSFNFGTSTGPFSITGVGFQPRLIQIVLQHPNNSSRSIFGYGFYDGTTQFASFTDTTETSNSTTNIIRWVDTLSVTVHEATATSLDADGFTLNVTTSLASIPYAFIAFK